jgi:hypothetical protein
MVLMMLRILDVLPESAAGVSIKLITLLPSFLLEFRIQNELRTGQMSIEGGQDHAVFQFVV